MADGTSVAAMLVQGAGVVPERPVVEVVAEERIGGRRLNASHAARLERASRLAAGSLNDRRRAAALVKAVQQELAAEAEADAVQVDMDRAMARMGDVEVEQVLEVEFLKGADGVPLRADGQLVAKARTVRRVSRIDGVVSLWRVGALDDDERRKADAYRKLYASALPPIGYSSFEGARGGSVDKEALMCAAIERGKAAVLLARIRVACGHQGAAALEAIAGEGRTVRSMATGRACERITQALRDSLIIADAMMRKAEEEAFTSGNA